MGEGAYSNFYLREEGLIREGALLERGLNRAFTVIQNQINFQIYLIDTGHSDRNHEVLLKKDPSQNPQNKPKIITKFF